MVEWIASENFYYWVPEMDYDEEDENDKLPEFINVTDVLDLHGTNIEIIPEMINEFISNALLLGLRQVRIVHGKGKSRLKFITHKTLDSNKFAKKYYDAPPELGGWGATIIEIGSR